MAEQREIVYRVSPEPRLHLPMGARSAGHFRLASGYREPVVAKTFVQLFWGIAGAGTLVAPGGAYTLGPGDVGAYFPGDVHDVRGGAEPWEYAWWTLDGPRAEAIARGFGLQRQARPVGPAPRGLLAELIRTLRDVSPAAERRASVLAYELLAWATGGTRGAEPEPLVREALAILHREWADPTLGIEALADRLGTHRSRLSRRFREAVGVPPLTYLTSLRVQHGLSLLKQTQAPIAEIARDCGYADANYFARRVRERTGLSPREFRSA